VNAIGDLIPLDKESCLEIIEYSLSLRNDHEIQNHFLNLLGETPDSMTFMTNFFELKEEEDTLAESAAKKAAKKSSKQANKVIDAILTPKTSRTPPPLAWSSETKKHTPQSKGRLEHNSSSTTTSELMDHKPSNQLSTQQVKRNKKKNVDSLKDIEAVLNELELAADKKTEGIKRVCNCLATRHPLFEIAPNCLNCGKIICTKEGLQPCSYCGKDLLSFKDKWEIMNVLKQEKDEIENKQENLKKKKIQEQNSQAHNKQKSKRIVVTLNAGENLWHAQDRALKEAELEMKKVQALKEQEIQEREDIEKQELELEHYHRTSQINPDLLKAQERLDTLLDFQDTGAERTRIIDNAADYELPSSSSNMWLSPVERALQLKKQHKQLRKYDESVSSRTGRGEKSVEMVIKDGKVTMVEKHRIAKIGEDEEDKEIVKMENDLKQVKAQNENQMSKNIWDFEGDKQKWDKPIYRGTTTDEDMKMDMPKNRVQFAFDAEENELLDQIPS